VSRIYICSKYRADTKKQFNEQLETTKEICRKVTIHGHDIVVPHLTLTQFLDDNVQSERELGMKSALRLMDGCDYLYVYIGNEVSHGMEKEIEYAKKNNINIRYFRNINELHDILKRSEVPKDRQIIVSEADKCFAVANPQTDLFNGQWNMNYFENESITEDEILGWREL